MYRTNETQTDIKKNNNIDTEIHRKTDKERNRSINKNMQIQDHIDS